MRFKIDWAIPIDGSKFTVLALFYFVFEGNFPSTSPRGAYIWRGDLTEGFLRCRFGGLIFGGAYKWRGLFSEFYGMVRSVHRIRAGVTQYGENCVTLNLRFRGRLDTNKQATKHFNIPLLSHHFDRD